MKRALGLLACAALGAMGCTTGEGEGFVTSDRLYLEECWNGQFDLKPTFFGANPFREETLMIRIQRGDDIQELSDGLSVLVSDIGAIRDSLGEPQAVGVPAGVETLGVPQDLSTEPPLVSLSLYLHDTCHAQIGTVYSISGSITFTSLFSGDVNEPNADDRLTEAEFTAEFADPRHLTTRSTADSSEVISTVEGYFRFFFQRGKPAQPFP